MVGMMLCAYSGTWNCARSPAKVTSHSAARAQPNPSARPRTIPTIGIGARRNAP
jgi:hypothetical protein